MKIQEYKQGKADDIILINFNLYTQSLDIIPKNTIILIDQYIDYIIPETVRTEPEAEAIKKLQYIKSLLMKTYTRDLVTC